MDDYEQIRDLENDQRESITAQEQDEIEMRGEDYARAILDLGDGGLIH